MGAPFTWSRHEVGGVVQQEGAQPGGDLLAPAGAGLQALHRHLQQAGRVLGGQLLHCAPHHPLVAHGKTLLQQLVVVRAQGLAEQDSD